MVATCITGGVTIYALNNHSQAQNSYPTIATTTIITSNSTTSITTNATQVITTPGLTMTTSENIDYP